MVSFVVETYVAADLRDRFTTEADAIRRAASAPSANGRVRVLRSYTVPGDGMGFHVIEADTVEDVARLAATAGIEVERIVEAIGVEPDQ
jgi:hypothetical protein